MKYCFGRNTILITLIISFFSLLFWTLSIYLFWNPKTSLGRLPLKFSLTLQDKIDITQLTDKTQYKKGEYYVLIFKDQYGKQIPGCQADYEEFPQIEFSIISMSKKASRNCDMPSLQKLRLSNCMSLKTRFTEYKQKEFGYVIDQQRKCKYEQLIFNLEPKYHGIGIPVLYCFLGITLYIWSAQIVQVVFFKVYKTDMKDYLFLTFCTKKTLIQIPQQNKLVIAHEFLDQIIDEYKIRSVCEEHFQIPSKKAYIVINQVNKQTKHIDKMTLMKINNEFLLNYTLLALIKKDIKKQIFVYDITQAIYGYEQKWWQSKDKLNNQEENIINQQINELSEIQVQIHSSLNDL